MNDGTTIDVTDQATVTSSDTPILAIEDGEVVTYGYGEVDVTVSYEDTETVHTITVKESTEPVTIEEISPSESAVALSAGNEKHLQAKAHLSDFSEDDITQEADWTSDDESIATVEEGTVTGVSEGETTITIQKDGVEATVLVRIWNEQDFDNVWIYEDFENVENGSIPEGWTTVFNGKWEVEDGRLKGSSETNVPYDETAIITFPLEVNTNNFEFEADISFESVVNTQRYASLMFYVAEDADSYYNFAMRQGGTVAHPGDISYRTPSPNSQWEKLNEAIFPSELEIGKTYRFKLTVSENRVLGFIEDKLVIDTDDVNAVIKNGNLGLQTSGSVAYFDNVKVSLHDGELPDIEDYKPFMPVLPDTGVILPPTVMGTGMDSLSMASDWAHTGVSSLEVTVQSKDGQLKSISDNQEIGSLSEYLDFTEDTFISILRIDDMETAKQTLDLLDTLKLNDVRILSEDPEIMNVVRKENPLHPGGIVYSTSSAVDAKQIANETLSNDIHLAVLDKQLATKDTIRYLQARGITVWGMDVDGIKDIHAMIHNGVNGIISTNPLQVVNGLEVYEKNTISHHQLYVAHRGNVTYMYENTLEAFEESASLGADLLEFDVYKSRDDVLFIYHDAVFKEEHGGEPTDSRDYYGDIENIDLDGNGAKVPTFKEFLQTLKKTNDYTLDLLHVQARGMMDELNELIVQEDMEDRMLIQSFFLEDLIDIHEINPKLGTLLLGGSSSIGNSFDAKTQYDFLTSINSIIGPNLNDINPYLRDYGFVRGMQLWPWTFVDEDTTAKHLRLGSHAPHTDIFDYVADDPLRIESTEKYSLEVGETIDVLAEKIYRESDSKEFKPEDLVIIGDGDIVSVDGNKVNAEQEGTTLVLAREEVTVSGDTFNMYTNPIEISVKPVEEDPEKEDPEKEDPDEEEPEKEERSQDENGGTSENEENNDGQGTPTDDDGKGLAKTATNYYTLLAVGGLLLLLGMVVYFYLRLRSISKVS